MNSLVKPLLSLHEIADVLWHVGNLDAYYSQYWYIAEYHRLLNEVTELRARVNQQTTKGN